MKNRFGTFILLVAVSLVLTKPATPEPAPPIAAEFERDRIRTLGVMLNIVSEEMIAVADCDNVEEHLIGRSEKVFDDFAKDADFIGPDFITKPLARKAVRPVVKTVVRYVDKKTRELSHEEHEDE